MMMDIHSWFKIYKYRLSWTLFKKKKEVQFSTLQYIK